jgi:hypothetical protein
LAMNRKKQLLEEYRNRRPEMGVISYRCVATNESFLGTATDTQAAFNSTTTKLNTNFHPNKRLLELWNQYGEDGFQRSVLKTLNYENPADDHIAELEALREQCLSQDPQARRIWK